MLCCQVSELFLAGLVMQTDLVPLDELPHKEVAECYVLGTRAEHSVPATVKAPVLSLLIGTDPKGLEPKFPHEVR